MSVQKFPNSKIAEDFYSDLKEYKKWEEFVLNDSELIKMYKGKWLAFQNKRVLMSDESYHKIFYDETTVDCLLFSKVGCKKVEKSEIIKKRKK